MNLVWFDRAREAIQKASQFDEVKDIRDKAEALRLYTKQVGEGLQMQNWCAEIKIRAERRAGELLAEMEKHKGGNPNWLQPETSSPQKLVDLGIDKSQSHRFQAIASLPEKDFESHVTRIKASGKELTSAGVYRQARNRAPVKVPLAVPRSPPIDPVDSKGRTPYVHWVNSLRQIAALLEEINRLGGFDAIIKRLTPAQVEDVITDVHRLDQQVHVLVGDVNRMGTVIQITATTV